MSKKNKNKNNQDYTSFKTENETTNEDKELVKYLYDKEIERSKLIVEKSTAAFFLFAVDSGFLAINWKELFVNYKTANWTLWLLLISVFATAIIILSVFFFTTKINKSDKSNNEYDVHNFYVYLHQMNDKKERLLAIAYVSLSLSVCLPVLLKFLAQLF